MRRRCKISWIFLQRLFFPQENYLSLILNKCETTVSLGREDDKVFLTEERNVWISLGLLVSTRVHKMSEKHLSTVFSIFSGDILSLQAFPTLNLVHHVLYMIPSSVPIKTSKQTNKPTNPKQTQTQPLIINWKIILQSY